MSYGNTMNSALEDAAQGGAQEALPQATPDRRAEAGQEAAPARRSEEGRGAESVDVNDLISRIEAYANHPDTIKSLTKLMERVDQSSPMRRFRAYWNGLSHVTQWGLMHVTKALSGSGPIQTMVRFGFIDYKGHKGEDGQIMEEKIISMGGWEKFLVTYGVKFGKYVFPELKAVEPFVGPLLKLDKISVKTLSHVRVYLRSLHQIQENPENNISAISDTARSQMDSFSLLPTSDIATPVSHSPHHDNTDAFRSPRPGSKSPRTLN